MTHRGDTTGETTADTTDTASTTSVLSFSAKIHDRMGIEILEASPERVVGTLAVEGNQQPFGLLHGGASCVLAESLGSIGATLHGQPDRMAVGVDINATHHRGVREGVVTGVATPIQLGRTVACYEIVITDESDRRVCTARLTCQLIARSS
jgi:1,4-dihydroxy-2-naphthoyl-CoA hydrolase